MFAGSYAKLALDEGWDLPFAAAATWVARESFAALLAPLPLIFLLFPNGQVATRRWRPVLWVMLGALVVNLLGYAVTPGLTETGFTTIDHPVANPLGLPLAWKGAIEGFTELAGGIVFIGAFLAVISLALRFRRSQGEERQQIKWLAYLGAVLAAIPLLGIAVGLIRIALGVHVSDEDLFTAILFVAFVVLLILGIPAACGVAILKYRLYELDVVVKKTVVFAILVALAVAVGLVVLLIGAAASSVLTSDRPWALVVGGIVVGLALGPLRRLATRLADRVVYGGRATPYEVLTDFSERVGDTYSTDDVLPRMAQILAAGTRAESATVWLRVADQLRAASTAPGGRSARPPVPIRSDALPDFDDPEFPVQVRHQGELLGALSVTMPPNDPMNSSKERLVRDLASQAGPVLRNVRLIEELRASRQRLVAAQDQERRKLERNIHDGAQQQLVALAVQLKLAEHLAGTDAEKEQQLLGKLVSQANSALEDLRDLARGIYPPLLADKGLAAALEAQARKAAVPTTVETDGVARYPQEVESAVYFCVLEALNNAAKYAEASHVAVTLARAHGQVTSAVTDDGRGFDPTVTGYGTGLQGMADRLDAVGGRLEVESSPGAGASIHGAVRVDRTAR
jgi:signal transduction histidine kinase